MTNDDGILNDLRKATQISPDNVPLRRHLADTLLRMGLAEESEQEYRSALTMAPDDLLLKIGLATAFYTQGKNSQAMVIVESLMKLPDTPAKAYLLHARLLIRDGAVDAAVREYRKAIDADPSLADPELSGRLGIAADTGMGEVVNGRVRVSGDDISDRSDLAIERPPIAFKDVGGMERVKDEIRMKIIHPLNHPELYKAYGKAGGGGILLYGPPGCGKTYLARATAGEIRSSFLAVGINDILDMWLGNSERNLHEVFEHARKNKPCVLFFDEVDALGASRSDMRQSAGRQLINQFLAELDGVKSSNEGILILAATNAPWHLDTAFRRPGRFDRLIFAPPPDIEARAAILRILLRGKPIGDIDHEHVAKKTEHFSGADLKSLVDIAVEQKLREAIKEGSPRPLTTKDLLFAVGDVKPSTKEWFSTARNYALYANQSGFYDDIMQFLKL